MRRVIIRADGGGNIGFGHITRMLSLARLLCDTYGIRCTFYSNPYTGLEKIISREGFACVVNEGLTEEEFLEKAAGAAVAVVDRLYPYSAQFIRKLSGTAKVILVQNECPGMFDADVAFFPSAHLSDDIIADVRWQQGKATFLYGPDYVLLSDAVVGRLGARDDSTTAGHMAITTGASDPEGMLLRFIEWLDDADLDIPIKALVGFDFVHRAQLEKMRLRNADKISVVPFNHDDLVTARLVVAAFGVTAYEVMYAGIPLITVGHAERNAVASSRIRERYGCTVDLGLFADLKKQKFLEEVTSLWESEERRCAMRERQLRLLDGKGLLRLGEIVAMKAMEE